MQCDGGAGGGGHHRHNDLDVRVQQLGEEDFPVMKLNQSQDDAKTSNSSGSILSCTNLPSPARTNQDPGFLRLVCV